VEDIDAGSLMADKGYDTGAIVAMVRETGMEPVVPPRSNRRERHRYDECLCRLGRLGENAFAEMKRWRGIAMRYAKNAASYLAAVHIRCIITWARLY
jgi:transposase